MHIKSVTFKEQIYDLILLELADREAQGDRVTFTQVINERLAKAYEIDASEFRFNKRSAREETRHELENALEKRAAIQQHVKELNERLNKRFEKLDAGIEDGSMDKDIDPELVKQLQERFLKK